MRFRARSAVRSLIRHRSTRVTPDGIRFLLFTLAIGVAAINTGNNLFYLLLAMMLSLILMSGIMADLCLRKLDFHRHVPDLLYVGEPATVTVAVINRKRHLSSFSLRLLDASGGREFDRGLAVHHLPPGARQFLTYPLLATRRGRLSLGDVRVSTRFPFGLFVKQTSYPADESVIVCPEIATIEGALLQEVLAVGFERSLHRRGQGHDLYNLRPYQPGDDSRSIHWITTARTSKLVVRETEAEDQRRATLVLSTVAPDSHDAVFEEAVTCTASLAHLLSSQGYQIRLRVGEFRSAFGQGDTHLVDLLQNLAVCERRAPAVADRQSGEFRASESDDQSEGAVIAVVPWEGESVQAVLGRPDLIIGESVLAGRRYAI